MDQNLNIPEEWTCDGYPIGLTQDEKLTLFILLTKIGFDFRTNLFMGAVPDENGKDVACNVSTASSDDTDLACNVSAATSDDTDLACNVSTAISDDTDLACNVSTADDDLPTLPDSIFPTLPALLQKVVGITSNKKERDCMLLVAMVTLSSCLHKISALYDGRVVFPNLFFYLTAPASAGKGRMDYCLQLVNPIDQALIQKSDLLQEQYEKELEDYKRHRALDPSLRKPKRPPELMLHIPANNSATGLFQMLAENGGKGLIFETEGDAIAGFKADNKIFTMGLRKAYHHEKISYNRRTNREHVEILLPRLSLVLTATPGQVADLIPNAENGLFSRFIFYYMSQPIDWKDVFADNKNQGLAVYFGQLGQEFYSLYQKLELLPGISFSYSQDQQTAFNAFFKQIQKTYLALQGPDYMATIRRLGIIAYRLSMIFTALRMAETDDFSPEQSCNEVDFQSTLSMITVLIEHSGHVFNELQQLNVSRVHAPQVPSPLPADNKLSKFLALLPAQFSAFDVNAVADSLSITERTARRYLTLLNEKGLVRKEGHGLYTNLTILPPEGN